MSSDLVFIAQISVKSSVAVMLASIGEILAERSGILNLGVEGMMLAGALGGFYLGLISGNPWVACAGAMFCGGLFALVHAFFAITLRGNQVLSGLALTLLCAGLTNVLGRSLIQAQGIRIGPLALPLLSDIPVLGPVLFRQPPLTYAAYILAIAGYWFLSRTRAGLTLRAVGENAEAANAAGVNVSLVRYLATLAGGMLAGLGGAYLSLSYTPGWKEGMSGGQGWIAIAMVIFAAWGPVRVVFCSLIFGFLTALQFYFQVIGVELIPGYVLRILPYFLTILVLVLVGAVPSLRRKAGAPGNLGLPFTG